LIFFFGHDFDQGEIAKLRGGDAVSVANFCCMPIPRALRSEIAVVRNDPHLPTYGGSMLTPAHYDAIIQSQGRHWDYFKLYEDIERDAHAFSVLQTRKMDVVHREWMVEPGGEKRADKKLAEMVETQLKNLSIHALEEEQGETVLSLSSGFDNTCYGLLNSVLNGVSYGEIMWAQDGREIYPEEIRIRKPRRFGYVLGDRGYRLRLLTRENPLEGEPVPPRKILVHHHQPEHGPYGLGLGHRLYWPCFFKREDIKFWLLFVDKFAAPSAIVKYPRSASEEEKATGLDALNAIATETGIAIPEDMMIELLEAQRSGSINCYESLARWCDEQISEAVLGQTGTTNQSSGGGSRARDEVAERVSLKLAKFDADMLSETLNKQLVKWICHFNDPTAEPPKVWRRFPELEEFEDLNARAGRDKTIVDMMGRKPTEKYIVDTYDIELEEPEEEGPDPLQQLFGGEGEEGAATASETGLEAEAEAEVPEEAPTEEPAETEEEVPAPAFAEVNPREHKDAADDYTDRAQAQIQKTLEEWTLQLQEAVEASNNWQELEQRLFSLFPELNDAQFAEVLGQAIATAELAGRYEVLAEEPEEPPTDLEEFGRAIALLTQMDAGEVAEVEIDMPIDFSEIKNVDDAFIAIGRLYVEEVSFQEMLQDAIAFPVDFAAKSKSATTGPKKKNCNPAKSHFCQSPNGSGSCVSLGKKCRFAPGATVTQASNATGKGKAKNKKTKTKTPKATAPKAPATATPASPVRLNQGELDSKRNDLIQRFGQDAVDEAETNVKRILADADVYIRVGTSDTLEKILGSEFKTSAELGIDTHNIPHLQGGYQQARNRVESKIMGYALNTDPGDRPIYGYLGGSDMNGESHGDVSSYGSIAVKLRSEVKDRTTFTGADSFKSGIASEVNNPNAASLVASTRHGYDKNSLPSNYPRSYSDNSNDGWQLRNSIWADSIDDLVPELATTGNAYIEAQIHGKVRGSDIAELHFQPRSRRRTDVPTPAVAQFAKANNVAIYVNGQKLSDTELDNLANSPSS
jgi:phage gp29-like protein